MAFTYAALDTITPATVTDLVQPGASNIALAPRDSLTAHNFSGAASTISIYITDSGNSVEATLLEDYSLDDGESFTWPGLIALDGQAKLRVKASQGNTSFYVPFEEYLA